MNAVPESQISPAIVAALIAGVTSLVVTLLTQFFNLFSGPRIERLRSELTGQIESTRAELTDINSSRSARRDYEYDARKRLYAEIEPLLFQLFEMAEQSYFRVINLARSARLGALGTDETSWLRADGYYLISSMYYMVLPAVIYRLIRNRMTFIDLDLDEQITAKYYLTKIYAFSLTDDFILAQINPRLDYDPNNKDWSNLVAADPARYRRQGLVLGDMEALLDQLIKKDEKGTRAMTFAEFESELSKEQVSEPLSELRKLFLKFNPTTKPVFARMLLIQGCLSNLILESYELQGTAELRRSIERFVESDEFGKSFAWADEQDVSREDRDLVRDYLTVRLSWIPERGKRQGMLT
ncbi:hypothetical protein [Bradyrhizobium sp. 21]|uniref:hypothetical protein n=1 Tax=Bradyrhizobium sp. 21 TaxID=2782666 RepID=UPI001FF876C5|nr:hypothetical protein [Bradyrhizobium sp. 21]MCK1384396.1 hypothetical protein [Bradyrhizobium sp. 21]